MPAATLMGRCACCAQPRGVLVAAPGGLLPRQRAWACLAPAHAHALARSARTQLNTPCSLSRRWEWRSSHAAWTSWSTPSPPAPVRGARGWWLTRSVWPRRGAQEQHADAPLPPLPPPRAADPVKTLTYALDVSQKLVVSRTFRSEVLRLVIRLYEGVPTPDYAAICQCLTFLDDPAEVAKIIHSLLSGSGEGRGLGQAQCVSAHPWRCCTHHARGVCAARPPTRGAAASRAPCSGPGAACLPDCFRPGGQRDAELYGQGARKGGVGLASPCGQPGSAARLVHGVAVCGTLLAPRGLLPFMCAQVKAQLESLSPGSSGASFFSSGSSSSRTSQLSGTRRRRARRARRATSAATQPTTTSSASTPCQPIAPCIAASNPTTCSQP